MSLAYHQVAKNRCSRVTAQTHDVNDVNNPFHAVRLAIENLSDDQVRGLIRALVHGLVQGMIAEVAARTDDIVDDAVQSISNQIATAAEHLQQVSASAAEVKSSRCQDGVQRTVKSRDVVYDVVVRFFVVVVQEVSAAGVSSCSVGVSLILRDLLRTSRPR